MRSLIVAAALAVAAPALAQPAAPVRTITPIRGDLYKVQSGPGVQPVTVFLVTRDGIVLADPLNPETATWLKGELAQRFPGKPVRYVLESHYHWDHARAARSSPTRRGSSRTRRWPRTWRGPSARRRRPATPPTPTATTG